MQLSDKAKALVEEKYKDGHKKRLEHIFGVALMAEFLAIRYNVDVEKAKAQKELDAVGPMIAEASKSVSNIKKSNLDEIRRLTSPPDVIKNTLWKSELRNTIS